MKENSFSKTVTVSLCTALIPAVRLSKLVTIGLAAAATTGAWFSAPSACAQTISLNSGSLGAAGNATNSPGVVIAQPGALNVATDMAAYYSGGSLNTPVNTTLPFNSALNPSSAAPFTIEFWANPTFNITDGSGPAPVFNRISTGDRSGWVFFQRAANQGWNFAMYNGNGSQVGLQLTGGTYTPGLWTHVVAVWDGTVPRLFVNGVDTMAPLVTNGAGGYNASTSATFSVGSYANGENPFTGAIDETAFYGSALSAPQILAHFNAASSTDSSVYSSLVVADGAVEYLRNIPEPTSLAMLAVATCLFAGRRRRSA